MKFCSAMIKSEIKLFNWSGRQFILVFEFLENNFDDFKK